MGDSENEVLLSLDATYPLSEQDYAIESSKTNNNFDSSATRLDLTINPSYLNLVKTGDQLNITVQIIPKTSISSDTQMRILQPLLPIIDEPIKIIGDAREILQKAGKNILENETDNFELNITDLKNELSKTPKKSFDKFNKSLNGYKLNENEKRIIKRTEYEFTKIEETFAKVHVTLDKILNKINSGNPIPNGYKEILSQFDVLDSIEASLEQQKQRLTVAKNLEPSFTSSRDFTFYKVEDYRDRFVDRRIRPDDISAFPLPRDEMVDLFGHYVAGNYFVVRLSVRNTEAEEKIINSGMIRVSGRAMVEFEIGEEDPVEKTKPNPSRWSPRQTRTSNQQTRTSKEMEPKKKNRLFRYTIPIEVTPHSKEQIYTIVDDTEVESRRSVFFSGMEFFGALATGYNSAFIDSKNTAKAVGLFTGIYIPEYKKLYANRYPDYKRNIVNYAMDDLTKVPANGITTHKFLFFPRSKIESVITDPNSYGKNSMKSYLYCTQLLRQDEKESSIFASNKSYRSNTWKRTLGFQQPDTFIVHLNFDNMDIPLEYSVAPADRRLAEEVIVMESKIREEINLRKLLTEQWRKDGMLPEDIFGKLKYNDWVDNIDEKSDFNDLSSYTDNIKIKYKGSSRDLIKEEINNILTTSKKLYLLLGDSEQWRKDLIEGDPNKVEELENYIEDLKTITRALARGGNPSTYKSSIKIVEAHLEEAQKWRTFYTTLASYLHYLSKKQFTIGSNDVNALAVVQSLNTTPSTETQKVLQEMVNYLIKIEAARGPALEGQILDGKPIDVLEPDSS